MQRRDFLEVTTSLLASAGLASAVARPLTAEAIGRVPDSPDGASFVRARRFLAGPWGRVAYVDRGRGPAALFLHGFPLSGFQWRGAIARLARYRRCIVPDFLGLGFTEVAEGQAVTPAAQVAMLIGVLDALRVTSVDLIANDSGGAVAQLLAVAHPERVRTILLTNCDAEPDSPPPALLPVLELARAGTFADQWLVPWVNDRALARSPQGLGGLTYTFRENPTDEAIDNYLVPLVSSAHRKALTNAYAVGLDPNPLAGIEPHLKRSRIPTRILWGTGDTTFSRESPGYLDRTLGNSRGVREIAGANLFWPEEFPEIVTEEARALWR